mgnify:CR=1 FL=1
MHSNNVQSVVQVVAKRTFVDELLQMAQLGLLGVNVPDEWGGAQAGVLAYSLALSEIATLCGLPAPTTFRILNLLETEKFDLSSLRSMVVGGSAAPQSMIEAPKALDSTAR